jgi:hypothetical protein
MDYIGIDTAPAMRARGFVLWEMANRNSLLIEQGSLVHFTQDWHDIPIDSIREECSVMLVFSYFFASKSLTVHDVNNLAAWVARLAGSRAGQPLALFYVNSKDKRANEQYYLLKRRLGLPNPDRALPTRQIEYDPRRTSEHPPRRTEFVGEMLTLHGARKSTTVMEGDLIPF